jgi:oxygen-dependent protoporphyrinogen oxidase
MRVAVIGGGIAGLAAAHALLRAGSDPIVFEASDRPGGKVGSVSERGFLTEDGPHFIARPLDGLLDAAGVRGEMVPARKPAARWVHLGGEVMRAPSRQFLRRAGIARALLEPFFARPLRDDMPLRAFLASRVGERAGTLIARAMAAGVYAGDADALSARDAFPSLGALAERGSLLLGAMRGPRQPRGLWNLQRGLGSLAAALAGQLGARVRLRAPVARLEPGWRVDGERFDAVVLATPARAAAELCRPFAPRFSDAAAELRSAPITVVHLGLEASEVPIGFGMIDLDAALTASGTLFPSSMLPGRAPAGHALVAAICGGALHPERARLPDAELVSAVRDDLRRTFGIRGEPSYQRIVRHAEAIPQYAPGHRERVQAARALLAEFPRLALAGAAWDGVSVPQVAASGESAARDLA